MSRARTLAEEVAGDSKLNLQEEEEELGLWGLSDAGGPLLPL